MTPRTEQPRDPGGREVRLEGVTLFVATSLLVAALVTAFYLGRWSGTGGVGTVPGDRVGAPLSSGEQEPLDVTREAGVFDEARSEDALEPGRQARPSRAEEPEREPPGPRSDAPAADGSWQVQVFAGRDRTSAETLVKSLRREGYDVRMSADPEGRETLYKVRVGGYEDRAAADAAAKVLRAAGHGAWVVSPK